MVGRELALEVGQLGERPVELGVREVVGDGDVRVVGEAELDGERPAAYGLREQLALGDPLDHGDEDDRRDGPEGAGAAEVDPERVDAVGDGREMLLDGPQLRRPRPSPAGST